MMSRTLPLISGTAWFRARLKSQVLLSWMLAVYVGLLLNFTVLQARFAELLGDPSFASLAASVGEPLAAALFTFVLLRLFALAGSTFWKAATTLLTLICAAAAYYTNVCHVVIGYGIVASVFTTDVDLSKDVC